jgi:hypothetical protein
MIDKNKKYYKLYIIGGGFYEKNIFIL